LSEEALERGYLLDTRTTLWALERPEALSDAALKAVSSGPNILSVVSYWEVTIKSMKGTLDVGDPRVWWREALEQLAATALPLRPEHVGTVYGLPPFHKDPFDRALIAQAKVQGLALITADAEIARYVSEGLRVVQ
jgi:PIN domain nuclease of toxin-antitoxin system